jgi:hypothetical protein
MNLQENIHRIQEIMGGVITEDRMDKVIKNMIDSMGIESTFKIVGDYDLIGTHLTDEDKINFIKDQFDKINGGNHFTLNQISQKTIQIKEEDGELHQIEALNRNVVSVVVYDLNNGSPHYLMRHYPKYEELSSDTIDKLFRMMLSRYN